MVMTAPRPRSTACDPPRGSGPASGGRALGPGRHASAQFAVVVVVANSIIRPHHRPVGASLGAICFGTSLAFTSLDAASFDRFRQTLHAAPPHRLGGCA